MQKSPERSTSVRSPPSIENHPLCFFQNRTALMASEVYLACPLIHLNCPSSFRRFTTEVTLRHTLGSPPNQVAGLVRPPLHEKC